MRRAKRAQTAQGSANVAATSRTGPQALGMWLIESKQKSAIHVKHIPDSKDLNPKLIDTFVN